MSEWIAQLMGPVLLTLAVPMIFTPDRLESVVRQFLDDPPLILVTGVLAMVAGLAIVNVHNLWIGDWRLVITLFGWALTIGGGVRVLAPQAVENVGNALLGRPMVTRVSGLLWAALGAFLCYRAYA